MARPNRIGNFPIIKKDTRQVTFATIVGTPGTEPGRGVTNVEIIAAPTRRDAVTMVLGSGDAVAVPANRYNFVGACIEPPQGYGVAHKFMCTYNFEFSADFSQHNMILGGLYVGRVILSTAPLLSQAVIMQDSIYLLPMNTSYVNATGDHCNASASGSFVLDYTPTNHAPPFVDYPVLGWFTHNISAGVVSVDDMMASLSWNVFDGDIDIYDPLR